MIKFVSVVVLAIPNVGIEEVEIGEERDHGQRHRDPAFRLLRDAFTQARGAHLVHEQERGRDRQKDPRSFGERFPAGLVEDRVLPEEILARGEQRKVVQRRAERRKQGHHGGRVYTSALPPASGIWSALWPFFAL